MKLSDAIKELALGAVNAESPVDVMPAEVVSANKSEGITNLS